MNLDIHLPLTLKGFTYVTKKTFFGPFLFLAFISFTATNAASTAAKMDPGAPSGATTEENGVQKVAAKGTVALTFDDGPTDEYTPQILAILKKYNVKATFFEVGNMVKAHPNAAKQVAAAGMAINSHSLTHPMLTKVSEEQLHHEVQDPQVIIFQTTGKKPLCLRYPFNDSNSHVRAYIRSQGIVPIAMGFNSFDYDRPGVDKIVAQVLNTLHSGEVILMHDGFDKREQTVAALPAIIEGIRKKGYGFSQICVN